MSDDAPGGRTWSGAAQPRANALIPQSDGPRRPRTSAEFAYETIRKAIIRGSLPPGSRLTQHRLSDEMSLSVTPIREALRRLDSEGLIRIDVHRGAVVRDLDPEELKEVYELRLVLESLAIKKAVVNITEQELSAAGELCDQMDKCKDLELWSDLNRRFHAIFAQASNSPYLARILDGLRGTSSRYIDRAISLRPEVSVTANQQHRALLEACCARDGDAAAKAEAEHLLTTLRTVLQASEKEGPSAEAVPT